MFIEVRYGHNETLICNPYCIVVNLMRSIQERTGFTQRHMVLDLSDETGLVKDLDLHRLDKADKFLTNQGPYILVEKQAVNLASPTDEVDGENAPSPTPSKKEPVFNFIPLLDDCEDLFPEYKVRVAHVVEKKKKPRHQSPAAVVQKSPSPAGKKPKKKASAKKK